jgi:hypothetical protein
MSRFVAVSGKVGTVAYSIIETPLEGFVSAVNNGEEQHHAEHSTEAYARSWVTHQIDTLNDKIL